MPHLSDCPSTAEEHRRCTRSRNCYKIVDKVRRHLHRQDEHGLLSGRFDLIWKIVHLPQSTLRKPPNFDRKEERNCDTKRDRLLEKKFKYFVDRPAGDRKWPSKPGYFYDNITTTLHIVGRAGYQLQEFSWVFHSL